MKTLKKLTMDIKWTETAKNPSNSFQKFSLSSILCSDFIVLTLTKLIDILRHVLSEAWRVIKICNVNMPRKEFPDCFRYEFRFNKANIPQDIEGKGSNIIKTEMR